MSLSEVLDYYVQKDEAKATSKRQTKSKYSTTIRRMKKKRNIHLKTKKVAEMYESLYYKNETTLRNHLVPRYNREETK